MTAAHERLGELFLEAVELDPIAREALVARVREADAELAAKLVALIAADADVATVLQDTDNANAHATQPGHGRAIPATAAARAAPAIPGFRIVGLLGEGGMGEVYAAEQDAPRRPAAIKVLHTPSPHARARFVAEAEIMARLDHPGIARVFGAGEADGRLYLAMEQVEGTTLDAPAIATRPLVERLRLFAAICDAVHHAHQKGVIHRDLKPANVMVRPDGRVAVLDFGVARLVDATAANATRAGELIGTPVYMSPEQARLRPDEVDARSDVYSLAVMFYELCSGALPYTVRGMALPEVARAICDDEPRRLGDHDRALRGNLEAVAARGLAKLPAERYPSAAAFAEDLRRHLAGHAVLARTPSALEQLARFARRRPAMASAIVAIALVVIGFATTVTMLWFDAKRARDRLAAQADDTLLREARAEVAHDPAAALRAIAALSTGADRWRATAVADEARGRGVATDVVHAHAAEVHAIDTVGDTVITAGFDGRVRLWPNLATTPRDLVAAPAPIQVAKLRPDGRAVVVAGGAGFVRVVALDGSVLAELSGHTHRVKRAAWSGDGAWLATADDHGGVWLWPHGAGPGRALGAGTTEIESLAIAEAGDAVVAGDSAGNLWWWPITGDAAGVADARRTLIAGHGSIVGAWVAGSDVAAVTADGHLVRDHATGEPVLAALGAPCRHAAFERRGRWAIAATTDGAVLRIADDRAERVGQLAGHVRVAIADGGRRFAAAGGGGDVEVWDRETGRVLRLRGHEDRVRMFEFTQSGAMLLTGDDEGVVRRWDLDAIPPTMLAGDAPIDRIATAGVRIVAADRDGTVWAWTAGGARRLLGVTSGQPTALVALPDGGALAGMASGEVLAWDATTAPPPTLDGPVTALAASEDGRVRAAASATSIAMFGTHPTTIAIAGTLALAIDPQGRWLAAAGKDGSVRAWPLDGSRPPSPMALGGPPSNTRWLLATGDRLAAGGDDGQVRIWDHLDPSTLRVVAFHAGGVSALASDPTGRWLVSAGRDHRLARISLSADRPAPEVADIHGTIASLAVAPDGTVLAVTAQHDLVRWTVAAAAPAITDDHVYAVAYLAGATPRWAAALADGAIALWQVEP